jgi:hypothetical protein
MNRPNAKAHRACCNNGVFCTPEPGPSEFERKIRVTRDGVFQPNYFRRFTLFAGLNRYIRGHSADWRRWFLAFLLLLWRLRRRAPAETATTG